MKEENEVEKVIEKFDESLDEMVNEKVNEKMEEKGEERVDEQKAGKQQGALKQDDELMDQLDTLLKEAEQVGYLRARNEIAEAMMNRPRLWENSSRRQAEQGEKRDQRCEDSLSSGFLRKVRPSVWD